MCWICTCVYHHRLQCLVCPSLSNVCSRPEARPYCPTVRQTWRLVPRTYAGGNGRAALLVAFSTAVARDTSHAVFTGTLSCGLVTGFASSTHGMAITCCEETEEEREAQWVVTHTHTHTHVGRYKHILSIESAGVYTAATAAVVATIIEWWETGGGVHRETELTQVQHHSARFEASVASWQKEQHILYVYRQFLTFGRCLLIS